jgi:hypothetical protein
MKLVKANVSKLRNLLMALLLTSVALYGNAAPVFAHGGEDHGDEKPKVVSTGKGMIVRISHAGDFEITLKHSPIEPDTETSAKLFITRFGTNEPLADAKTVVEITTKDGKTFEVSEVKADAPGSYSFKLPPLPEGTYTILTRLSAAGTSDTATFSSVAVESAASESPTSGSVWSWLRTTLMFLAAIVILSLLGGLVFYALRFTKQDSVVSSEEAVSA